MLIWHKKKVIVNREKSKITKHLIFPFLFLSKGDTLHFLQRGLCIKGLIWSPFEPKTETLLFTNFF